jgi:hypothetical protein
MSKKPKTTFDVRRYLTLVQILAIENHGKRHTALQYLCAKWGIDNNMMKYDEMIQSLAVSVVKYHEE